MLRLYDFWESGNAYKVRLFLSRLGEPFERVHLDILAGADYSIADISLYAYTHVADEGGFELGRYPAIRAWLDRVAAQPGHIRITDEVGLLVEWP